MSLITDALFHITGRLQNTSRILIGKNDEGKTHIHVIHAAFFLCRTPAVIVNSTYITAMVSADTYCRFWNPAEFEPSIMYLNPLGTITQSILSCEYYVKITEM